MRVLRCADPEEFLSRSEEYRAAQPVLTSVLSSVPLSVLLGTASYADCFWWIVWGTRERCLGAAFRTAPHNLHLGPMSRAAISSLARAVSAHDDDFPGVTSSEERGREFLRAYRRTHSPGSLRAFAPGMRSVIYELGDLGSPRVEGASRRAAASDVDLIRAWTLDFQRFVGQEPSPDRFSREFIAQRVANDAYRLWIVQGVAVSMAGYAPPVAIPGGSMARIGPVFTPEHLRGSGYGSAITASLSAELRARGSSVMLYADADYPASNHVYQKLGFVAVGGEREFRATQ